MIDGVRITPLARIPDERGTIYHMLRRTDPHFEQFGEIYFSSIYPGVVKGWHLHHGMTLNYACIAGRVKVVIYDDRAGSPTRDEVQEVILSPEDRYALLTIPPELWNGFQGLGTTPSIVANCATEPHDPDRTERIDPVSDVIPYRWDIAASTARRIASSKTSGANRSAL
jgi:dTDP-4-dehydrorhamnose 3,5-epimerase